MIMDPAGRVLLLSIMTLWYKSNFGTSIFDITAHNYYLEALVMIHLYFSILCLLLTAMGLSGLFYYTLTERSTPQDVLEVPKKINPASKGTISRFLTISKKFDIEECIICTEVHSEDSFSIRACGHTFHKQCIEPWLRNHGTCPLCRTTLEETVIIQVLD
jgi:hypothetical protein